jgi:antitoxin ParD1/3/4
MNIPVREVAGDGLHALEARHHAVDRWLMEQVGSAYDALRADLSRAVAIARVRARIAAEHTMIDARVMGS